MFILLFVSLILSIIEYKHAVLIDSIAILIFGIDTVINIYKSESKKEYIKKHPLEILSLVPISPIFRVFKTFSLVINFFRLTVIGKKYIIPVTNRLNNFAMGRLMIYFMVIFFLLPLPMIWLEPNIHNYPDLLWWSIQTVTTVGYGDIIISSGAGKIIASLLMILGIGIITTLTSGITQLIMHTDVSKNKKTDSFIPPDKTISNIDSKLEYLEEIEALIKKEKLELLKQKKQKS